MSLSDMKLYAMSVGTLGVTTFTQIEDGLKILLLLITIGSVSYTHLRAHET